jgi:hypothetical protein
MFFVFLAHSPGSVIVAGYAAVTLKVQALRPKVVPPIFRDRSLLCRLDAGGVFQDGPKTPNRTKWPSRLRAHFQTYIFLQFSVVFGFTG